jgi:hypothetical protein
MKIVIWIAIILFISICIFVVLNPYLFIYIYKILEDRITQELTYSALRKAFTIAFEGDTVISIFSGVYEKHKNPRLDFKKLKREKYIEIIPIDHPNPRFPEWFGELKKLDELRAVGTSLTKLPDNFGDLKKLASLTLN